MSTAVMTDSNSGISPQEAEQIGIYSVNMPVIIDGKVFHEGVDITREEFFAAQEQGKDVTSSQPTPAQLLDVWNQLLEDYDEIIYIPMSSELSNSCHISIGLAEDYDGKVQVADNHRISITMRRAVLDAIWMAKQGMSAKEIKNVLEKDAYNASIYIAVDTLEYLKKGGRVTAAGAALGTVLNVKPILTIQGKKLDAFAKVRGMKKCETKIIESLKEDIQNRFGDVNPAKVEVAAAGTLEDRESIDAWVKKVQENFPQSKVYYDPLSLSVACHIGRGSLAAAVTILSSDE